MKVKVRFYFEINVFPNFPSLQKNKLNDSCIKSFN